jgi:hypothetical protein
MGQERRQDGYWIRLDQTVGSQTGKDIMVIKRTSGDATEGRSSDETSETLEDHQEEQRRTGGSRREGRISDKTSETMEDHQEEKRRTGGSRREGRTR